MFLDRKHRSCARKIRQLVTLPLATLVMATMAYASPKPDQVCDAQQGAQQKRWWLTGAGIGLGIEAEAAQTFTVGASGLLTGVEVQIFKGTNVTQKLGLEIRKTAQSAPADRKSEILARKTISPDRIPAAVPKFVHVDLKEFCLQVSKGDVLAIVLGSQEKQGGYGWQTVAGERYGRGERFARSSQTPAWSKGAGSMAGHDLGFKTFIDPEAKCSPR